MGEDASCPVCAGALGEVEASVCDRCGVGHHPGCWDYVEGCGDLACRLASGPEGSEEEPGVRLGKAVRLSIWWRRVFQLQWGSFLLALWGFSLLPALTLLGARLAGVLLGGSVLILVLLSSIWVFCAPILIYLGWVLARRLGFPLRGRSHAALSTALRLGPWSAAVWSRVEAWPRTYARIWGVVTVLILVLDRQGPLHSQVGWLFLGWGVMGYLLSLGLRRTTWRRLEYLESVRHRFGAVSAASAEALVVDS